MPNSGDFRCDIEEIEHPEKGIIIYDQYNPVLEGEKLRYDYDMHMVEGKQTDFYNNTKVLHEGTYKEGRLKSYKNFFPNEQIERQFKFKNEGEGEMKIFYINGQLKSRVKYSETREYQKEVYDIDGTILHFELNHKKSFYPIKKSVKFEDGSSKEEIELVNEDSLIYLQKNYSSSGNIISSGKMMYNEKFGNFIKEGEWNKYNDSGEVISEIVYENGKIISAPLIETPTETIENKIPAQYMTFDTDGNQEITPSELDMAINRFFEDETIDVKTINGLINFFFDQD